MQINYYFFRTRAFARVLLKDAGNILLFLQSFVLLDFRPGAIPKKVANFP